MRHQTLEFQCDRIEAVLARHKVSVCVTGGVIAPRWIQFQVLPALGARVKKIKGLAEEIALALGSDTCRISRQGGRLAVEIPRPDPRPVRLLSLQRPLQKTTSHYSNRYGANAGQRDGARPQPIPFGAAVLGLAEDGGTLLVCLPAPQVAHILIAGTTGSGKTALAKTIVTSLAMSHRPSEVGFILVDPNRRAFGPLAGLPHLLRPVLSEPEATTDTLRQLVELMLGRDRDRRPIANRDCPGEPRVIIVIDELADLLMASGKETQDAITRLAQRGRAAGIHLVACTQKPAARVVGSLAKANFPVRLVGRVTSPEDAKVATGYAGTGAERLQGPGDFIAVNGGQMLRFQAAYIPARELTGLVSALLTGERDSRSIVTSRSQTIHRSETSIAGPSQKASPDKLPLGGQLHGLAKGVHLRSQPSAPRNEARMLFKGQST